MLTRVGGSAVGQAAKAGVMQGVAGRTANLIQGKDKDSNNTTPRNESLEGWFPGR
jgi:hypothetical protein